MKALLIIDLQKDFLPGGALPAPGGDKIIPEINRLQQEFDLVLASRDWHPDYSVHFDKWPVHCVKNTDGADYADDLDITRIQQEFLKGTMDEDDGYSAFEATNENLDKYLKDKDVDELYLVGLTTEYCVKQSAIDAAGKGFRTYVFARATAGVNAQPGDEPKAYQEMHRAGVKVIKD